MAAVLRAGGVEFDVDRFCAESSLTPEAIRRRGDPVFPGSQPQGRRHEQSFVNVVVSDGGFRDLPRQASEATEFLLAHRAEVSRLVGFPGVEGVELDFGIARRDVVVQSDSFPTALVRVAGELGLSIGLTQYPVEAGGGEDAKPVSGSSNQG